MRVLLSGGGTGGHVYPILAVVDELRKDEGGRRKDEDGRQKAEPSFILHPSSFILRFVGEAGGIEEALAQRAGIPFSPVASGQIRGRAPWHVARSLGRMARGAEQCAAVLREFRPDVVFITGGYVAAPVAWAAWRQRIPLLIYLPDLEPGLAIRLTGRLATAVAVSFPEVTRWFGPKAIVTGYPVRRDLLAADKTAARAALGLHADLPTLLVFGGSRGAHSLNQALVDALPELLPRCQVLHIAGQLDWDWVEEQQNAIRNSQFAIRYHPYPYLHDEMVQALAAADLVVARAGASTLGEFPAVGLPSILVPYPYSGQHQAVNAAYLVERGAALILPDRDLPGRFASTVVQLLDTPERLVEMATAARALARPDAAANIARVLRQLGLGQRPARAW